jgi:hypothetical protein
METYFIPWDLGAKHPDVRNTGSRTLSPFACCTCLRFIARRQAGQSCLHSYLTFTDKHRVGIRLRAWVLLANQVNVYRCRSGYKTGEVFCDITDLTSCSLLKIDLRFGGSCHHHVQSPGMSKWNCESRRQAERCSSDTSVNFQGNTREVIEDYLFIAEQYLELM